MQNQNPRPMHDLLSFLQEIVSHAPVRALACELLLTSAEALMDQQAAQQTSISIRGQPSRLLVLHLASKISSLTPTGDQSTFMAQPAAGQATSPGEAVHAELQHGSSDSTPSAEGVSRDGCLARSLIKAIVHMPREEGSLLSDLISLCLVLLYEPRLKYEFSVHFIHHYETMMSEISSFGGSSRVGCVLASLPAFLLPLFMPIAQAIEASLLYTPELHTFQIIAPCAPPPPLPPFFPFSSFSMPSRLFFDSINARQLQAPLI